MAENKYSIIFTGETKIIDLQFLTFYNDVNKSYKHIDELVELYNNLSLVPDQFTHQFMSKYSRDDTTKESKIIIKTSLPISHIRLRFNKKYSDTDLLISLQINDDLPNQFIQSTKNPHIYDQYISLTTPPQIISFAEWDDNITQNSTQQLKQQFADQEDAQTQMNIRDAENTKQREEYYKISKLYHNGRERENNEWNKQQNDLRYKDINATLEKDEQQRKKEAEKIEATKKAEEIAEAKKYTDAADRLKASNAANRVNAAAIKTFEITPQKEDNVQRKTPSWTKRWFGFGGKHKTRRRKFKKHTQKNSKNKRRKNSRK